MISREKMTDLLTDMYILEGFFQEVKVASSHMQDTIIYYYGGLFEKHGVTRWEFQEALACYLLHEKEMQKIHDEVLQRLSIYESEIIPLAEKKEAFEPYVFIRVDETKEPSAGELIITRWRQTLPSDLIEAQQEPNEEWLESEEVF